MRTPVTSWLALQSSLLNACIISLCTAGSPQSPESSRRAEADKEAMRSEGALSQADAGAGWVQVPNPDGHVFYHNPQTGEPLGSVHL